MNCVHTAVHATGGECGGNDLEVYGGELLAEIYRHVSILTGSLVVAVRGFCSLNGRAEV